MHVCPEWTAELDLYLDGELAADDRRRLERHLDACEGCRSGLMRREETKASLRSLACATTCSSEFASVEARRPRPRLRRALAVGGVARRYSP